MPSKRCQILAVPMFLEKGLDPVHHVLKQSEINRMEHGRGVQVRRRDPVKSRKNVLAQSDTKAAELDVRAV